MSKSASRTLHAWGVMAAVGLAVAAAPAAPNTPAPPAFKKHLQVLTAGPHRLAGRPEGSLRAAAYVKKTLETISKDAENAGKRPLKIFTQEFPVTQPRMTECKMVVGGEEYPLYAVRPNLVQATVTPEKGLTGRTLYVGKGTIPDYQDRDPRNRIVVVDFDAGDNWLTAFSFGARAVIFLEGGLADHAEHHINLPANLPRFYATGQAAELLKQPQDITLFAAAKWEPLRGQNIIALIPGTDPTFVVREKKPEAPNEAVVLAASLDSYGEVPELAAGARDAANAAALLAICRHLALNRPQRDVIVCFFDGQSQCHGGARRFYGAISRRAKDKKVAKFTIEDRLAMNVEEQEFLDAVAEYLTQAGDEEACMAPALPFLRPKDMFYSESRNGWLKAMVENVERSGDRGSDLAWELRKAHEAQSQALAKAVEAYKPVLDLLTEKRGRIQAQEDGVNSADKALHQASVTVHQLETGITRLEDELKRLQSPEGGQRIARQAQAGNPRLRDRFKALPGLIEQSRAKLPGAKAAAKEAQQKQKTAEKDLAALEAAYDKLLVGAGGIPLGVKVLLAIVAVAVLLWLVRGIVAMPRARAEGGNKSTVALIVLPALICVLAAAGLYYVFVLHKITSSVAIPEHAVRFTALIPDVTKDKDAPPPRQLKTPKEVLDALQAGRMAVSHLGRQAAEFPRLQSHYGAYVERLAGTEEQPDPWLTWLAEKIEGLSDLSGAHHDRFGLLLREEARRYGSEKLKKLRPLRVLAKRLNTRIKATRKAELFREKLQKAQASVKEGDLEAAHKVIRDAYASVDYARETMELPAMPVLEEDADAARLGEWITRLLADIDAFEKERPQMYTDLRQLRPEQDALKERVKELEEKLETATDEQQRTALAARLKELEVPDPNGPVPPSEYFLGEIGTIEVVDLAWNGIQALVHKRRMAEARAVLEELFEGVSHPKKRARILEVIPGRFEKLTEKMRELVETRRSELGKQKPDGTWTGLYGDLLKARDLRDTLGPKRDNILVHISVNLGDARNRWTFIQGEDSFPNARDNIANYSTIFKTIRRIHESREVAAPGFDARSVSQTYNVRMFAPGKQVHSGAIATLFGLLHLSATTVMDPMVRQGQPADTPAALDADAVGSQTAELSAFLGALIDNRQLGATTSSVPVGATYIEGEWSNNKYTGPVVSIAGMGGAMRKEPSRGGLIAILDGRMWQEPKAVAGGFNHAILHMTDSNGIFELGPVAATDYTAAVRVAAGFERTRSSFDTRELPGHRGLITSITTSDTVKGALVGTSVELFNCRHMSVVDYGPGRGVVSTTAMRALSTSGFQPKRHLLAEFGKILSVYPPLDVRGVKLFNARGMVLLKNENNKREYQGRGISLADPFFHPVPALRTARDLRTLNAYRLKLLRDNRINQESLEVLNGRSLDLQTEAEKSAATKSPAAGEGGMLDRFYGLMGASAALGRKPYGPLKGVMNDLVTAVVLLLLLAMPFAFALERLLIGTPHIYRQIGWFAGFFIATFAVLYVVNPAFKLASTPIIIFLAFAIIVLSVLVISIMIRKLQAEIKKMQGLATTVHSADVSRLSTMMAAVNMGISTMRRRPLRTALTAVTVLLLTFTILTFASFGSSWGLRTTYEGPMSGAPERSLIRHPLWSPIDAGSFDVLRGALAEEAVTVARWWVAPTAGDAQAAVAAQMSTEMPLADASTATMTPVAAAIGLDRADVTRQKLLAELFASGAKLELLDDDGIFLTDAVRRELQLTAADIGKTKVLLKGHALTYAGVVRDAAQSFTMLEGSSMLPVDYEASGGESVQEFAAAATSDESLAETPEIESAQFVHFNVDRVVVVSPATAKRLGGQIRSICVYPKWADDVKETAELAATVLPLPVYYGERAGVYRLIFTSLTKASGVRDLLIPVVLGGLIIFATMLGSVSDREREIYTFSSLGLAPPHIASLFFAEASMYAIIGGMGGYLLGQIVARLLAVLSGYGLVAVPTMNYSSTNAMVTILIVMGTVLLSTVYPAMKASRSANPGIQRSWKIPKPAGNLFDLVFPFTVSAYDITGVVSFLKEHFDNFSDTSMGVFATTECDIFRQADNDMLAFEATVALAPFDLGVNQRFAILSQPSDIEGIDEVRIFIYRLSGSQGDWQRANRVFINDLRKQLLIWRSLTTEIMDQYRQQTLQAWEGLEVKRVDGQSMGESA